ncbi:MAG: co-chaperone GroES [Patescibacteria group bacterium]
MIKPLSDHVVIEPLKEEKKKGGIILPDTISKERQEQGKVIAAGPGKLVDGKRIPLQVKKGDIVVYSYGHEVKVDGKEYTIVAEDSILAVID